MSVQIKSLTPQLTTLNPNQVPLRDETCPASDDLFNVIPATMPTWVYDLYKAPKAPPDPTNKAAIVKSIRLRNKHTGSVKVTLYFNRPNASNLNRRRLLTPEDMLLPPGFAYIDEGEITLEPGDKIQAKADTAKVIEYVISGVERDVT